MKWTRKSFLIPVLPACVAAQGAKDYRMPAAPSRLNPIFLRLYRAGILVAIAWLMHTQHRWFMAQEGSTLDPTRLRDFFPAAASLGPRDPDTGVQRVLDGSGVVLGMVAQTSPLSDKIIGYSGPTNTLIACDPQGKVIGVRVLRSDDTPDHMAEIIRHRAFFNSFKGLKLGDTTSRPKIDAVSGATLTSTAIAEGVLRRLGQPGTSLRFPDAITLEEVKAVVPEAATLTPVKDRAGILEVKDASGKVLAQVTRTSPASDAIVGYKGPADTLMVLDPTGEKLVSIRLRKSFDTKDYVADMAADSYFMSLFNGMSVQKLGTLDFKEAKVEGVSGATETSWALAEGLKRRAAQLATAAVPTPPWYTHITWKAADWGMLVVLVVSLLMTFTSLRGKRWMRWVHHALLIGYAGLFSGAMISQGLFVGWARHGVAWQSAPMLVLVAALALITPWLWRRGFYCHHYCPHGALQQVLAHRLKWQLKVPHKLGKALEQVPWLLLIFILVVAMFGLEVNVNALEPFDAWLIRVAGWGTITVAIVGLVASLFIPMAYCRYGCPTGALLKFVRYAGHGDAFGKRDVAALVLVAAAVGMLYLARM
ncbi:FMN-binding protein [Roseimicrobium sp. ORNL1]|uniref:FMN-binding protein n=1 Tax=Roseimicrobium sp. ORNL1 TaxID=2711231 RepID=UPI0019816802|nr:FMN-binding protein [Roseimicrobium sp. ORNL1]